jgi:hypothetical protein
MAIESPFMTADEAAAWLRYTPEALTSMRKSGRGPRFYQPAGPQGRVLYRLADLEEWVESGDLERNSQDEVPAATV